MTKNLRFVVSVGLLTWIACHTDWSQVAHALTQLRWELTVLAVLCLVVAQLASAWRWQLLARPLGLARPFPQMLRFYCIGMYFNLVLPTSVGGDVVRAWYLDGRSGQRMPAFVTVFLDRLCGLLMLLLLAGIGVALCPLPLPAWLSWSVWGCVGAGLLCTSALPLLVQHNEKTPWKFQRALAILDTLPTWRVFVWPTVLSVGVQVANILLVWLLSQAIGDQTSLYYFWVLVPVVSLVTLLPISINGTGVREVAMVTLLAPLQVSEARALTLAFLWFAVVVLVSLVGGLFYLFGTEAQPLASSAPVQEGQAHGFVDRDSDQGRTGQLKAVA